MQKEGEAEGPGPERTRPWQGHPAGEGGTAWGMVRLLRARMGEGLGERRCCWKGVPGSARRGLYPLSPSCCPIPSPPPGRLPGAPCCRQGLTEDGTVAHVGIGQVLQYTLHRAALPAARTHATGLVPRPTPPDTAWHESHMEVYPLKYILKFCCLTKGRHPTQRAPSYQAPAPGAACRQKTGGPHRGAEGCRRGTHLDTRPLTHAHTYIPPSRQAPALLRAWHSCLTNVPHTEGQIHTEGLPHTITHCRGPRTHIRV